MGLDGVLQGLAELYHELDQALSVNPTVNPCGACNACCRSEGRVVHGVSELELLYLESRAGNQAAFRDYLSGRGAATCPHHDPAAGCRVYAFRPFSCRVFGHYSELEAGLPPGCTYREQAARFRARERLRVVPGAARLKHLQLELTVSAGRNGAPLKRRPLAPHERLDEALQLARRGDAAGAVRELERALHGAEPSGYTLHNAGLIYALAGRPEEALNTFVQAAADLPLSADVRYYAATQARFAGQPQRARELAEEARALAPEHAPNLSLLGSLYLAEGRYAEARECLQGLAGPLERYFLGEACAGLGDLAAARSCFAEAALSDSLREQAERALQALEGAGPK